MVFIITYVLSIQKVLFGLEEVFDDESGWAKISNVTETNVKPNNWNRKIVFENYVTGATTLMH